MWIGNYIHIPSPPLPFRATQFSVTSPVDAQLPSICESELDAVRCPHETSVGYESEQPTETVSSSPGYCQQTVDEQKNRKHFPTSECSK